MKYNVFNADRLGDLPGQLAFFIQMRNFHS